MMRQTSVALLTAVLAGGMPALAAELTALGTIQGEVRNLGGVTQMGATVQLYNRLEEPVQKALTGPDGKFRFERLSPDTYSVRVSLKSYLPASRANINVKSGMASYLAIQLATIFSTIELVYTAPAESGIVSDDWKWVLRSSVATRPVLRLTGDDIVVTKGPTRQPEQERKIFSATRGLMRVSAGDGGVSSVLGNEPDLGTAFALATSLFGTNELRVSGNLGYATSTGAPATGFRTQFSRTEGTLTPDVELTVRQVQMRQVAAYGLATGTPEATPTLRTMSVKVGERQRITDEITLEYGSLLETVAFLDRMNLFSPFARLTYDLGEVGVVEAGYSTGAPALDLIAAGASDGAMQHQLMGLAMFPRVSLSAGQARVQRSDNYEVGYRKIQGKRTYSAAVYREDLRDAAITVAAPAGVFSSADLMPDIASNSSIFNLGNYSALGYMVSVLQEIGQGWSAGAAYGSGGALKPEDAAEPVADAADLRNRMTPVRRQWASVRATGFVPTVGTRVAAGYVWVAGGSDALAPAHAWLTQRWQPQMGLNLQVRQPLPDGSLMPGKWEMTAEVRNLLANGYVPVSTLDGRNVYLIQFPRTLRGGLSFIF